MCVCVRASHAKLSCYNLMTQTVRATETGVGDNCVFNIVCVRSFATMHMCAPRVHAYCVGSSNRAPFALYMSEHMCICIHARRARQSREQVSLFFILQGCAQTGSPSCCLVRPH